MDVTAFCSDTSGVNNDLIDRDRQTSGNTTEGIQQMHFPIATKRQLIAEPLDI